MRGNLRPNSIMKSSIISFCLPRSPFFTNVVLLVLLESSYDNQINLTNLRSSSKASATYSFPPACPFHRSGNLSSSRQQLLRHLSLPISPTATGAATSLLLTKRYLVHSSSHSAGYHSTDNPTLLNCYCLPGRSLPLHSPAATRAVVSPLLTSSFRNCYLFPSH